MDKNIEELLSGAMGFYYPTDESGNQLENDPQRGYVRSGKRGVLELETLDENPSPLNSIAGGVKAPSAISGVTTVGSVLFLDVLGNGSRTSTGFQASIRRYKSYSAVFGVDLGSISNTRAIELEVFFPGIEYWAGMEVVDESPDLAEDRTLVGFTIKLRTIAEQTYELSESLRIGLSAHWEVRGQNSKRDVYAPITVICKSLEPVKVSDLTYPIVCIQDLLGLAFSGFVLSDGGRVEMAGQPKRARGEFWNYWLMHMPIGASEPGSMAEFPAFRLNDLGGPSALKRWIDLCSAHPRLVKPVTNHLRLGLSSSEMRLMELAAGMQYWCAVHKKKPSGGWAKAEAYPALAIAKHLGAAESFVGDVDKWADRFWSCYNNMKHNPRYEIDSREMFLLAESGHRILTAEALGSIVPNESARYIANKYLAHHRFYSLSQSVREWIREL